MGFNVVSLFRFSLDLYATSPSLVGLVGTTGVFVFSPDLNDTLYSRVMLKSRP